MPLPLRVQKKARARRARTPTTAPAMMPPTAPPSDDDEPWPLLVRGAMGGDDEAAGGEGEGVCGGGEGEGEEGLGGGGADGGAEGGTDGDGEGGGGEGGSDGGVEGGGGGGAPGGGIGGPTIVVVVVSAEAVRPRAEARAVGARAVSWFASACDAAAPLAEPPLTTVTCTATDCTVVLTPATALSETLRLLAMALVLTTGGARLPPLVALISRTTLKEAAVCIARWARSSRRRVDSGSTRQEESSLQTVTVRARAMSSAVTPAGSGTATDVVCTMLTSTASEVLALEAACVTAEASAVVSRVAAATGSIWIVEVVA